MGRVGYGYHEACLGHDQGHGHPETANRIRHVDAALAAAGLPLTRLAVPRATRADLLRNHTEDHVDTIERTCAEGAAYPDPDTQMGPGSWEAALHAAGGAIEAARAVWAGEVDRAFCAMRPPGHHAERDRAMGFCLFNNVAVAARWLQAEAGAKRIAILDWDVHHGNGTQHATYDDGGIYYVSLHQHPHYPGTGHPDERGKGDTNLNIRMQAGWGPDEWLGAMEKSVIPELEAFGPELLFISCGFDAHKRDPLAQMRLESATYGEMTRRIGHLAGGKIVSLLEGGYHWEATAEAAVSHVSALIDL